MRSVGAALVKLIVTATSGLVSFTTNVIRPVNVVCEFSPVQEGTGDPSPDNVRPISGWTGVTITHTSENLVPIETGTAGKIISASGYMENHSDFWSSYFFPIAPGEYFITSEQNTDVVLALTPTNTSFTGMVRNYIGEENQPYKFTVTSEYPYCRVSVQNYKSVTDPGVVVTKNIDATPINWQSEAGTVYGGTVTLNEDGSADLVVDKGAADLSTLTWIQFTKARYKTDDLIMAITAAPDNDTKIGLISEKYPEYTQNRLYGGSKDPAVSGISISTLGQLCVRTTNSYSDYGDTPSGKIVYPLINPIAYHFSSIAQLNSFLGTNNIWHDMNGGITAEYWNKQ